MWRTLLISVLLAICAEGYGHHHHGGHHVHRGRKGHHGHRGHRSHSGHRRHRHTSDKSSDSDDHDSDEHHKPRENKKPSKRNSDRDRKNFEKLIGKKATTKKTQDSEELESYDDDNAWSSQEDNAVESVGEAWQQYRDLREGVSLDELVHFKCQGLQYRTYFDHESTTCYVSVPNQAECASIQLPYVKLSKKNNNERINRKLGITAKTNNVICALTLEAKCEGVRMGTQCINVVDKMIPLAKASKQCIKKHKSNLFVPHTDRDIRRLIRIVNAPGQKRSSFWIGGAAINRKWEFHDQSVVDFFRWVPGQKFTKNSMGMVFLSGDMDHQYVGYVSAEGHQKKNAFVCSRPIENDYISGKIKTNPFEKPKPSTTTSSPKPTTTTPNEENQSCSKICKRAEVVFLVEISAMMSPSTISCANRFINEAATILNPHLTTVHIISYESRLRQRDTISPDWFQYQINNKLEAKKGSGGTNHILALNSAWDTIKNNPSAAKIIFHLSNAESNGGSPSQMQTIGDTIKSGGGIIASVYAEDASVYAEGHTTCLPEAIFVPRNDFRDVHRQF